jgi:MoaA/NifB/PqqE/SkfB family radical SAM enzyme
LRCQTIDTLQVNLGFQCNQQCIHCHLEASPFRTEMMQWPIMELVLRAAKNSPCRLVDVTGGAPEFNPYFCLFVKALRLVWVGMVRFMIAPSTSHLAFR